MRLRHLLSAAFCSVIFTCAPGAAQNATIPAYLATKAPKIDGKIDLGEWDAAGPAILVTADSPNAGFDLNRIPDDPFGGAEDMSFSFRAMWVEPYTAYLLIEVNDDIAMDSDPNNLWERDQIEFFVDGNDQEGNDVPEEFQWWDHDEPFGKFGVSRYSTFEGNAPRMSLSEDDIYADDETSFIAAAGAAGETGVQANYFVEYAVSLESMFLRGAFDGDAITSAAAKIVADHTKIKAQIGISDDDNFESSDGSTSRSGSLSIVGTSDWRATNEFPDLLFLGPYSPGPSGDFNGNGDLDVADIDALNAAIRAGSNDLKYDVTGDGSVNLADQEMWVNDLKHTYYGDANLDGEFNSGDLVTVFVPGKFETGSAATWGEGDWNGDGQFNSSDFVVAFSAGGYEQGPRAAVAAVPEPSSLLLTVLGGVALLARRRR